MAQFQISRILDFGPIRHGLNVYFSENKHWRCSPDRRLSECYTPEARAQPELQQQHVDRLHRHTIHTTYAGMAHANGPTARATVNCTNWWWGQEQRVVLNFGDADTTQKATGATLAQIDFVCVICTSNSSTADVASLSLPLSLSVSLFKGTSRRYRHLSTCPFIFSHLQRSVCTNGIYSLLPQHRYRLHMCTMYQ